MREAALRPLRHAAKRVATNTMNIYCTPLLLVQNAGRHFHTTLSYDYRSQLSRHIIRFHCHGCASSNSRTYDAEHTRQSASSSAFLACRDY